MNLPPDLIPRFLLSIIRIYNLAILARVLLSWIDRGRPRNRISVFVYQITEPLLGLIRRLLPRTGMIDWSPLVALLLLSFLERGIVSFF